MNLWQKISVQILRQEMARNDISFAELAKRLSKLGLKENRFTVGNKLSRGKFSAAFFVAALHAMNQRFGR